MHLYFKLSFLKIYITYLWNFINSVTNEHRELKLAVFTCTIMYEVDYNHQYILKGSKTHYETSTVFLFKMSIQPLLGITKIFHLWGNMWMQIIHVFSHFCNHSHTRILEVSATFQYWQGKKPYYGQRRPYSANIYTKGYRNFQKM